MNEKLIIRNFGPIRSVELELGRFNVLIGEQATGKSTVAKVLAMCRYFSYIVSDEDSDFAWQKDSFYSGLQEWGMQDFLRDGSYVQYDCLHYRFSFKATEVIERTEELPAKANWTYNQQLKPISEDFKKLLNSFRELMPKSQQNQLEEMDRGWSMPANFFQKQVGRVMDNPFLISPERGLQSIFSLGKSSIQNISDPIFNLLARLDQIARFSKTEINIEPLNILYKNVNGYGFVRKESDAEFVSLLNAARGYQSIIPIVLAVKYYTEVRKEQKTFIIEEPEMNLFPSAQQKLVQFLADQVNNHGHSMLITTHSPYVLTSLNNLLEAKRASKLYPQETSEVIDKKLWLNTGDIAIYMLLSDGACENILDKEEGLIKVEKIDGVSSMLNEQFNKLLNLEFGGSENDD